MCRLGEVGVGAHSCIFRAKTLLEDHILHFHKRRRVLVMCSSVEERLCAPESRGTTAVSRHERSPTKRAVESSKAVRKQAFAVFSVAKPCCLRIKHRRLPQPRRQQVGVIYAGETRSKRVHTALRLNTYRRVLSLSRLVLPRGKSIDEK